MKINLFSFCSFNYLKSIFFSISFALYISLSASTSITNNNNNNQYLNEYLKQNPLIDQLTAMLHQIQTLKECGNNLQKLNVDLEPLWSKKFKFQLQNAFYLTNIINNLFSSSDHDFSKIDSTYLASLSHVMFTSKQIDYNQNDFNLNNAIDPFLIGYGLILPGSNEPCIFINRRIKISDSPDIFQVDKTCNKMNYMPEQINANSYSSVDSDSYHNCYNWFKNLKSLYEEIKTSSKLELSLNYEQYLEKILKNKNFNSRLYCGPFYECGSKDNDSWVLIFSLPLFDKLKNFKGSFMIKLKLNQLDINQCSNGDPIFADTHKCKKNSECVFTPMKSFRSGNYKCKCSHGFLISNPTNLSFDGSQLEYHYWQMKNQKNNSFSKMFNCLPCSGLNCCELEANLIDSSMTLNSIFNGNKNINLNNNDSKSSFSNKDYYKMQTNLFWNCRKYNMSLRYVIFFIQIIFVLITISIAFIVFYSRHHKIIKHSMWILLEIVLFGAASLYSTLLIQHFEPTTNICLAIPWFREVGFTVVYGILNLRLYKILIEFQSRKAHCVQLKDKDILRILFFIIICVIGYLTAWTLVDLDYASEGFSLVANTSLKGFVQYPVCKIKWWDYFIEIAEFLFICVGFYLLYCTRTAPSEYNERKFISLVIYCEGIISTLLHVIKHSIFNSIHPDTILILYFIRCHSTVTVMILFIFCTKLIVLFKPNSDEYCRSSRLSTVEANDPVINSESIKFQIGQGVTNTDFDNGDLNLHDLEPEEIKSELKRLYTQLHIYKTKSVKKDNPHLQSKRRGMNKKHRRFSTQFQKSVINKENESYQVKTPDESICSNEANNLPHSMALTGGLEDKEPKKFLN